MIALTYLSIGAVFATATAIMFKSRPLFGLAYALLMVIAWPAMAIVGAIILVYELRRVKNASD